MEELNSDWGCDHLNSTGEDISPCVVTTDGCLRNSLICPMRKAPNTLRGLKVFSWEPNL